METGFRLVGRYRLQECVGSGGMAEVWRARDEVLGRYVAVKLVNGELRGGPAFHRRFREEARAAASLSHPRIVAIFDFGEAEGWNGSRIPYLVMEYLDGETLADRISRGPLSVVETIRVCGQIAEALAASHRAGIVHHDVKPANVFLTTAGAKVIDFGIARATRDDTHNETAPGWSGPAMPTEPLLGTPGYLAPEQLGRFSGTPAVDVYALGVVLTECLTGKRALDATLPSDVPVDVAVLCTRSRSSDPLSRPSAAEIAEILGMAALIADARAEKIHVAPLVGDFPSSEATTDRSTPTRDERVWAQDHAARARAGRGGARWAGKARTWARAPGDSAGTVRAHGSWAHSGNRTWADNRVDAGPHVQEVSDDVRRPSRVSGSLAGVALAIAAAAVAIAAGTLVIGVLIPTAGSVSRPTTGSVAPSTGSAEGANAPATGANPGPENHPTVANPGPTAPATTPPAALSAPTETIAALTRMRPIVDEGFASGEIRSDVAIDLNNVVTNLQNELVGGQQVDLPRRLNDLQTKISTRLREGGLTQSRADKLNIVLARATS